MIKMLQLKNHGGQREIWPSRPEIATSREEESHWEVLMSFVLIWTVKPFWEQVTPKTERHMAQPLSTWSQNLKVVLNLFFPNWVKMKEEKQEKYCEFFLK